MTVSSSNCWKSDLDSISRWAPGVGAISSERGVIGKDEFDRMEMLIGDWRKSGKLPLNFCANDEKPAPVNLEELDTRSPEVYAREPF